MTAAARRVVLASRNAGKLAEVRRILGTGAAVLSLDDFPPLALPPEDAETYEENALAKARAVARAFGVAALADDSGLEVDALGGAPGIRSSRYAGPTCDPAANNAKLLEALGGVPENERGARFVCVAALVTAGGDERLSRGEVEGRVAGALRGDGGFGYDPLFIPGGNDRTFAEMAPAEKDASSHRRRAFAALGPMILSLVMEEETFPRGGSR
jgi:XTP/dITP diphosphohydrolase